MAMNPAFDEDLTLITLRVGPSTTPDDEKTVFLVFKSVIMDKSGFFRAKLLESPEANDFILDECDADIFKIALDVISGKELKDGIDLETIFTLVGIAQILGIDGLHGTCMHRMFAVVNFQTVWKIYDKTSYERVIDKCEWLLSTRTQDLLNHPEFLKIAPETLAKFLRLKEMNIESETVLYGACVRFAENRHRHARRELYCKFILPNLRLLNMSGTHLPYLQSYLAPEQYDYLRFRMGICSNYAPEVPGLCLDTRDRRPANARTIVIEPDKDIYDLMEMDWVGSYVESPTTNDTFVLSFKMKKRALLQRIVFFCPRFVRTVDDDFYDIDPPPPYVHALAKVTVSKKQKEIMSHSSQIMHTDLMSHSASILRDAELPKSARVTIQIEFHGELSFLQLSDKSESTIFQSSDKSIEKVIKKVRLKHLHNGEERKEGWNTTVFKSVHMKLI